MTHLLFLSLCALCAVSWRRLLGHKRHPDWTFAQEIAVTISLQNARRAMTLPPERARAEAEQAARFLSPPKAVLRMPAKLDAVQAEWFEGPELHCSAVILYFHGGGYGMGSSNLWAEVLGNLALASRSRVHSIDYRLAPEHPYPAALEDALQAYHWLLTQDISPAQVVFAGDSAGGGLAIAALLKLKQAGNPMPAGAMLLSPWVDLTAASDSVVANAQYDWGDREFLLYWAKLYAGDNDLATPMISPLFADLTGLPPLQLHVGSAEVLRDEVSELAQRVIDCAGVAELTLWQCLPHGWLSMGSVFPQAADTLKLAAEFVQKVTGGEGRGA